MEQKTKNESYLNVVEIQLSYKTHFNPSDRPVIRTSEDAYRILLSHWDEGQIGFVEQFKVLLLNRANRVIGIVPLCSGGVSGTYVDVKLIFAAALKANASSIIVAHNHPSGNTTPSRQDEMTTLRIAEVGKALDLVLFDHIIVTTQGFYSFADEGGNFGESIPPFQRKGYQ